MGHAHGHASIRKTQTTYSLKILIFRITRLVWRDFFVRLLKILLPPCIFSMGLCRFLGITGNRLPLLGWSSENLMLLFVLMPFNVCLFSAPPLPPPITLSVEWKWSTSYTSTSLLDSSSFAYSGLQTVRAVK